jgi:ABC-2 type transport system permease protein
MSSARLAVRQVHFDVRSYLRNPPAVFFGLLLPVLFLLIFATIFGNDTVKSRGGIKTTTYYVPGLVGLGIVSTTFVGLSMTLVVLRENRVLKRLRGTPLPAWVFIAGRVSVAISMAFAVAVVLVAIGALLYGVSVPGHTLPGVLLALIVGAASFCCLGVAMSSAIPNEDAAPAVVNAVVLPLYFISGLFFPVDDAPKWLTDVANLFPIRHLVLALLDAFDPATKGAGIDWGHLAVVAGWGIAGLLVAMRTFRWTPRGE